MSYNFYASPIEPASPVPSHQASSQSGGTSPFANSVRSGFSVSTSPYSPSSATSSPSNPFSYADYSSHSSPVRNHCSPPPSNLVLSFDQDDSEHNHDVHHDKAVTELKSPKQVAREYGSNMRALELLEATAGADVRNVARPTRDEEAEGIRTFKNKKHSIRERGANTKALMLLQETAGYDVKCTAVPVDRVIFSGELLGEDNLFDEAAIQLSEKQQNLDCGTCYPDNFSTNDTNKEERISTAGHSGEEDKEGQPFFTNRHEAEESYLLRKKLKAMYKLKKATEKEMACKTEKEAVTACEKAEESYLLRKKLKAMYKLKKATEKEMQFASMCKDVVKVETENHRSQHEKDVLERWTDQPGSEELDHKNKTRGDILSYESKKHSVHESGATAKALMLLQETAGYDVKCTAMPMNIEALNHDTLSGERCTDLIPKSPNGTAISVNEKSALSSEKQQYKECRTHYHDNFSTDDTNEEEKISSGSHSGREDNDGQSFFTNRKEVDESYLLRKKLKAIYKLKKASEKEMACEKEKEAMAESTRKPKNKTVEDLENADSIACMKCSIDIERENFAKKKALQLLNDRPGCLA